MIHPTARVLVLCCSLLAPARVALAGTLCGTVTETQSGAPVAYAGVFLRTPTGEYTGINGATDAAGSFCIASVPAGTYDLEIRVDHEQVAYVRGVVVTTSTTDVDVTAAPAGTRLSAPVPNPARAVTHLAWTLASPSRVRIAIYDLRGRFVRGWSGAAIAPGSHSTEWDLRDASGRPVAPGVYFVRLDTDRLHLSRTIVRLP